MSPVQIGRDPTPWRSLGEILAGSLTARARGAFASEFALLDRENGEIGRLEIFGPSGAELGAGGVEARIEHVPPARYRMLSSGAEILTSTGSATSPEIRCLGRPYTARLSLLRNRAEAGPAGDEEVVRIAGGLTNRKYAVYFETGEEGSLPVALFLLYRIVALRREAYRAGP
jgi:hypothetical protein